MENTNISSCSVFGGFPKAKFLLPIDGKTLSPEFQESIRRTGEAIAKLDVGKIRANMPHIEGRLVPLITPITKYNEGQILPPIDISNLSPYYWETVSLADKIINPSNVVTPDIQIHESLLSYPLPTVINSSKRGTRKIRRSYSNK